MLNGTPNLSSSTEELPKVITEGQRSSRLKKHTTCTRSSGRDNSLSLDEYTCRHLCFCTLHSPLSWACEMTVWRQDGSEDSPDLCRINPGSSQTPCPVETAKFYSLVVNVNIWMGGGGGGGGGC